MRYNDISIFDVLQVLLLPINAYILKEVLNELSLSPLDTLTNTVCVNKGVRFW